MSGEASASQVLTVSRRAFTELTFHVAIFMLPIKRLSQGSATHLQPPPRGEAKPVGGDLNRKTRPAAAGGRRVRILDSERGADHLVGKIDLGPFEKTKRHRIDKHCRAVARNHQ